jgi:hypothetical protein
MSRTTAIVPAITAGWLASATVNVQADDATPAEARALAKQAYIWGYALVDDHRTTKHTP